MEIKDSCTEWNENASKYLICIRSISSVYVQIYSLERNTYRYRADEIKKLIALNSLYK
jgi:hypothetical protein